uniref:Centrosomal protein of 19 kDa n=1 Tax=Albugo laibachii Nc14 TaxID=890382 RepID=F0WJG1_9STRA|nr:hypothetical protein PITG_11177 [Albugo laibachii Nc14]|eukprot:CCA21410.1 hypothetical protein PITG_11177 [Albugo laibachii Nc14]
MQIVTQRVALKYRPPMMVIEYSVSGGCGSKKLYHHDIPLEVPLRRIHDRSKSRNAEVDIATLADTLRLEHTHVCGNGQISTQQVIRMLKMLYDARVEKLHSDEERLGQLPPDLPQADYNNVSVAQLGQVKNRMDIAFQRSKLTPGDDNYVYDKRIVYDAVQTPSEWDDE